ncbi:uncharacterized protein JCM10292_005682 [Rhodotorula paludigena]|uniref:uncharacterized protein n=1 Tax=Rhodotorula paludigena TaxID=86838 RepID=UPI00317E1705
MSPPFRGSYGDAGSPGCGGDNPFTFPFSLPTVAKRPRRASPPPVLRPPAVVSTSPRTGTPAADPDWSGAFRMPAAPAVITVVDDLDDSDNDDIGVDDDQVMHTTATAATDDGVTRAEDSGDEVARDLVGLANGAGTSSPRKRPRSRSPRAFEHAAASAPVEDEEEMLPVDNGAQPDMLLPFSFPPVAFSSTRTPFPVVDNAAAPQQQSGAEQLQSFPAASASHADSSIRSISPASGSGSGSGSVDPSLLPLSSAAERASHRARAKDEAEALKEAEERRRAESEEGRKEAERRKELEKTMLRARTGEFGWILQTTPCTSRKADNSLREILPARKCQDCTSKLTGHTCAFMNLRSFPLGPDLRRPLPYPAFRDTTAADDEPSFPTSFDAPFTPHVAALLKSTAATHLVSTLRDELAHAQRPDTARVRRALGVTHTCDACNASVLSGSWVCAVCGREYCLACRDALDRIAPAPLTTPDAAPYSHAPLARRPGAARDKGKEKEQELDRGREKGKERETMSGADYARDKLTKCLGKTLRHESAQLHPLARHSAAELARLIDEMERWVALHPLEQPVELSAEWVEERRWKDEEDSLAFVRLSGAVVPPRMDESRDEDERVKREEAPEVELVLPAAADGAASAPQPELTPSEHALLSSTRDLASSSSAAHALPPYLSTALPASHASLPPSAQPQQALFRSLWALGEPLVFDLAPPSLPRLAWTPAFFAETFGDEPCRVGSNVFSVVDEVGAVEREREMGSTVRRFFEAFGRRGGEEGDGGRRDSLKIKDWPSTTDFKALYPDLWHDFMSILPAGSITRRDGVLNISSHTPSNANPPDLGPKGYFSEISDDSPGGKGSTKLHTVNVMLWASDGPDGGPGVAIWDLYRAEDAGKLRDFLYGQLALKHGLSDAEAARAQFDDPIHTQKFYLDSSLRAQLFALHGVRSFRVHQRPGQAVFIPAGCAHQVCNFADCIKVATDFVSVENVARCWKVTDEFRGQTKDKVLWRSDVLQLKSMLLWAWLSAERFDSPGGTTGRAKAASAQPTTPSEPQESHGKQPTLPKFA